MSGTVWSRETLWPWFHGFVGGVMIATLVWWWVA